MERDVNPVREMRRGLHPFLNFYFLKPFLFHAIIKIMKKTGMISRSLIHKPRERRNCQWN